MLAIVCEDRSMKNLAHYAKEMLDVAGQLHHVLASSQPISPDRNGKRDFLALRFD